MKKGYSVVITTTDSANSRSFFISRRLIIVVAVLLGVIIVAVVVSAVNYGQVYLKAMQAEALKKRNSKLEKEFAKLEEIEKLLAQTESYGKQLKEMLGVEKTPQPVKISFNDFGVNTMPTESLSIVKGNIPSLLPVVGQISRNFGPNHKGIDIAAPQLSPVIAAGSGVVNTTGWDSLFGNYVVIKHNNDYLTFYGHLYSVDVKKGERVNGGQVIGTVGSTGSSTSPHLHYEVRFRGKQVDPMGYLPFFIKM